MNFLRVPRAKIPAAKAAFDAATLAAALITLQPENIARYGEDSGLVRSARLTVARLGQPSTEVWQIEARDRQQAPPETEAA